MFSMLEVFVVSVGIMCAILLIIIEVKEAKEEGREFCFWDLFQIFYYEEVEEREE